MDRKFLLICLIIIEFGYVFETARSDIFKEYDDSQLNIKDRPKSLKLLAAESTNASNYEISSNSKDKVNDQNAEKALNSTLYDLKNLSSNVNNNKNSTTNHLNVNSTGNINITQIKNDNNSTINSLLKNISTNYPELSTALNNTLKSIASNNQSKVLADLNTLNKSFNTSILEKYDRTDINKTVDVVRTEISKAVLKHQAETALKDLNKVFSKLPSNSTVNQTNETIAGWNATNGITKAKVPDKINFDPSLWLSRLQAPWKHVSVTDQENSTEVIQVCKFDVKKAICSAQYTKWATKLWFEFAEAPSKNGINLTVFEHGHNPRVTFYNKVNGTDCQVFQNGTCHQICLKVYGYDRDLGVTRVCLELGAAIFNHGVVSTDYGCFRFSFPVRHEEPFEGETPPLILLNSYILGNQYFNYKNTTQTSGSSSTIFKTSYLFILVLILYIIKITHC